MKIGTGLIGALRYSLRCGGVRLGAQAALATALVCLLVALAWWGPAMREQMRLQQAIDAHRAEAVEALRSSRVAHAQREALHAVAVLEKKLELRAGQAELIQGIARLASQRGVRVISQSFDQGRVQSGDAPLYLELGLLGNYPALRGLMDDLATLPMWIELVEARIDRAGESGAPLKAQLRLLTYRTAKGLP
jgi:Tfp pilus assembly protein PilO